MSNYESKPLSELKPNPLNPRGDIDPSDPAIQELAASIRSHGLLQPLVVLPTGIVVAGHRRLVACRVAGLESVSVTVRDLSECEQIEVMLIENFHRANLNSLQLAHGCKALQEHGIAIHEIAGKLGMGKDTVRKHMGILELPTELHSFFASNELALGYIFPLLEVRAPEEQIRLAKQAMREGWLVNQMSAAVNQLKRGPVIESIEIKDSPTIETDPKREAISAAIDRLDSVHRSLSRFNELESITNLIRIAEDRLTDHAMAMRKEGRVWAA